MLRLTAVVAALALVLRVDEALGAKPLFDDLHSEVVTLSKLNFNNNIKKNRDDHVSVVLFYAPHGAHAASSPHFVPCTYTASHRLATRPSQLSLGEV
jgi:hypothetical protein